MPNSKYIYEIFCSVGILLVACGRPTSNETDGNSDTSDTTTSSTSTSSSTTSLSETTLATLTFGTESDSATGNQFTTVGSESESSNSSSTSSSSTGSSGEPQGVCGDEIIDPGETCDDGKNNGQEGLCREDCTICGDGVLQADIEECDDEGKSAMCDVDCTFAVCGDGVVNQAAGESCESGQENTENCDADCSLPICGDGFVNTIVGEQCDDGNDIHYDGCEPNCQLTSLGTIAAGESNTCALLSNGMIRCWGNNSYGQLGYGNTEVIGDNEVPSSAGPIDLLGSFATQIEIGQYFACAIVTEGSVYCWGSGNWGNLGYGNTNSLGSTPMTLPGSTGAVGIGGVPAVQIALGSNHTCALLDGEEGEVRCWGSGSHGKLGYGYGIVKVGDTPNTLPSKLSPIKLSDPIIQITAGSDHTCALTEDHEVFCWGYGNYGLLGYANTYGQNGNKCWDMNSAFACTQNLKDGVDDKECCIGDNEKPITVVEPVSLGGDAIQVSAGQQHTCALLQTGEVVCWGFNQYGQLGYGNVGINNTCQQNLCSKTECCIGDNETPSSVGPVDLGGVAALQISAGANHTCALLQDEKIRCWGRGDWGQLGYGHTNNVGDNEKPSSEPPLDLGGKVIQIKAGGDHTCALLEGGDVQCWGYGAYGQLGYNNTGGNICLINNNFSCEANEKCCLGDKQGEVPQGPVDYK